MTAFWDSAAGQCLEATAGPSTALIASAINSAQRLSVLSRAGKKRVMEKMENDKSVFHLFHNPDDCGGGFD
jgi:hypothetical protein